VNAVLLSDGNTGDVVYISGEVGNDGIETIDGALFDLFDFILIVRWRPRYRWLDIDIVSKLSGCVRTVEHENLRPPSFSISLRTTIIHVLRSVGSSKISKSDVTVLGATD